MTVTILVILLVIGLAFNALGVIGILRFPDVYTRLHADTKATTFGSIFTSLSVIGYAVYAYFRLGSTEYLALILHVIVAVAVLAFTNSVGAHAIARAAHRSGVKPAPAVTDKLAEAEHD
jgi:multicomponent Na+:H+ antiporter subunit G